MRFWWCILGSDWRGDFCDKGRQPTTQRICWQRYWPTSVPRWPSLVWRMLWRLELASWRPLPQFSSFVAPLLSECSLISSIKLRCLPHFWQLSANVNSRFVRLIFRYGLLSFLKKILILIFYKWVFRELKSLSWQLILSKCLDGTINFLQPFIQLFIDTAKCCQANSLVSVCSSYCQFIGALVFLVLCPFNQGSLRINFSCAVQSWERYLLYFINVYNATY